MSYKNINALMRHLRDNGISISGSSQKRQLMNTGYFHGYKGYRFFKRAGNRIPFTSYDEVYATIKYDSNLKALFYDKIMFIETAVKNIALECILNLVGSENIQDMYEKVVCGYHNAPISSSIKAKKQLQQNKLNLESSIQNSLSKAYRKNNPKIAHFYNNLGYSGVPIWALFEIMTLGDFGFLLSCLTYDARDTISRKLGINLSVDTNRELVYKYIYALKDLRNAIAHNAVLFDTRFKNIDPTRGMKQCLVLEYKLPYVNFDTIGDYLILVCYFLKLLKVPKNEIKNFVREFERIVDIYDRSVSKTVFSKVVHPDFQKRIEVLKNSI